MRPRHTTYIKTMKIIDSCETVEQLRTAYKYATLAVDNLDRIQGIIVLEQFGKATKRILTQNEG